MKDLNIYLTPNTVAGEKNKRIVPPQCPVSVWLGMAQDTWKHIVTPCLKLTAMGLTGIVTYSRVAVNATVLRFLKKATFRGYNINQPAKKVNTEPAGTTPMFRCKEESRRVKTLRSSCFIQGAGLYCLGCTDAERWGAEREVTVVQLLLPASNVIGLGHRGSKTGKEVTAYISFWARQKQTRGFSCHYGVSFEFLGVNLPAVPYSGEITGWSITVIPQTI